MLYVGVGWAEARHAACLVDVGGRVLRRRFRLTPALIVSQRRSGSARGASAPCPRRPSGTICV